MALTDIASLSSLTTRYFFQRAFQPSRNPHGLKTTAPSRPAARDESTNVAVSHSRPPHLRDPRLSQRTSLLSCALPPPHRSPPYPPRFPQVRPTVPASVRPTVPASVRTTDSPAARRSFSVPPRFPHVRPTVPASVRTAPSPAARRSFSVGKCCAAFRSSVS